MASWTIPYRPEAMDREHSFFWQELDGVTGDDGNDFFGQFVDFDGNGTVPPSSTIPAAANAQHHDQTVPRVPEPLLLDQQQQQHPESSLGSSTADEFDFLSTSSHVGHDIDPSALAVSSEPSSAGFAPPEYLGRGSISDTDLPRVEGISLSSPAKEKRVSLSQPSSPTPPNTTATRKSTNRFLDAVQSTIRKATNRRKPRQPLPEDRPGSPMNDMPIVAPRQRPRQKRGASRKDVADPVSPQHQHQQQHPYPQVNGGFVHGSCDDPFNEAPPLPRPPTQYFPHDGMGSPLESPGIKSEPGSFQTDYTTSQMPPDASWQQHRQHQHQHSGSVPTTAGQWNGPQMVTPTDAGWWDYSMANQGGAGAGGDYHAAQHRNADINLAMHSQQAGLPYEYQQHHQMSDTANSGLMIQMPQPRPPQATVVNDLGMNAQTHLPPPPPIPASESRTHRPPRAPSSGARHLSSSPVRKTRAPSASPTRTTPNQKRHSSGGSVSSTRSASGRLPASVPGTPSGVRKRRSRDPSGGSAAAFAASSGGSDGGSGGGGGGVGFVNFTPNDGSMLMTGVAPSGSSKTKARREKEALDRRRKLSEAAMKAVAAAGGDVDQLMQQGFQF